MCIFCKIVEGSVPAYKVYEDGTVLAFLDLTQGTHGHTLVIPKNHISNVYEMSEETASQLFSKVPLIARALKKALNPVGLNIVNNNDQPLQTVFHAHIHLIPRYPDDGMILSTRNRIEEYQPEDYQTLAKEINHYVRT